MINTDYKCEAGEDEIDLTPLFKGTDLEKMINKKKNNIDGNDYIQTILG
jgi:hypothetical protein